MPNWLTRSVGFRRDALIERAQNMGLGAAASVCARILGRPYASGEFSPWQRELLGHVMGAMCDYARLGLPRPEACGALEAAVEFLGKTPPVTQQKMLDVLVVFEAGAKFTSPMRVPFSYLNHGAQEDYLREWEVHSNEALRAAFSGLKGVCMMGYWSRPETWDFLDYSLDTEPT